MHGRNGFSRRLAARAMSAAALLLTAVAVGSAALGAILHRALPLQTQRGDDNTAATRPAAESPDADDDMVRSVAAGIIGSAHDFTGGAAAPRDLCTPCHTPHLMRIRAPLLDQRPAATQPLRPYQTADVTLDSASLMCLGCHDGIIASDVYSRSHATALAGQFGTTSLATSPLVSHPVGVLYPRTEATYHPASSVTRDGRIKLPGGRIQCTTCHDPHNTGGHAGMLVRPNRRSALCLSCHRL